MTEGRFLVVDCLGVGRSPRGIRVATRDVIGAGPRTIAGVLEQIGLVADVVECSRVLTRPQLLSQYEVLMASGMTVDLPAIRRVKRRWNKYKPESPALVGGPISSNPVDAIERAGYDICVVGEAEETLSQILEAGLKDGVPPDTGELRRIEGIAFSEGYNITFTGLRKPLSRPQLNSYAPSTHVVRGYEGYRAARLYVEATRGCSNFFRTTLRLPDGRKCNDCDICRSAKLRDRNDCPMRIPPGCGYCSVPSVFGPTRSRSTSNILEEVSSLLQIGARRIVLSGSDFLEYGRDCLVEPEPLTDPREPPPNLEAVERLLRELTSLRAVVEGEASLMVENLKPNFVTERSAAILGRYLRDTHVHIGCETGSAPHSKALGRSSSPQETGRAVKLLRKHGLRPCVYFIHGLPGEGLETARKTARLIGQFARRGAEKITVYRFQPLPTTAFTDFSRGLPSAKSPEARLVVTKANLVNEELRRRWEGSRVEAVVRQMTGDRVVCYPMRHGPVIVAKAEDLELREGDVVTVAIESAGSKRRIFGEVDEIMAKAEEIGPRKS